MRNAEYGNWNYRMPLGTLVVVNPDQWNKDRRPTTIVGVNHLGQYITQRRQGAPYKVYPQNMLTAVRARKPKVEELLKRTGTRTVNCRGTLVPPPKHGPEVTFDEPIELEDGESIVVYLKAESKWTFLCRSPGGRRTRVTGVSEFKRRYHFKWEAYAAASRVPWRPVVTREETR